MQYLPTIRQFFIFVIISYKMKNTYIFANIGNKVVKLTFPLFLHFFCHNSRHNIDNRFDPRIQSQQILNVGRVHCKQNSICGLKKYPTIFNSPKAFGEFKTLLSPPPSSSSSSPSSPSPLKFLFPFLILSAFSPIFLICCLVKTCPNLPKLAQNCPNFPFLLFSHCFYKKWE